jgi:receptor-type tyrosine-protein phosphatase Q
VIKINITMIHDGDFLQMQIRCHQYWPEDNKPVTVFGDIVITKLMEDIQIDWTIRDLKIERVKKEGGI